MITIKKTNHHFDLQKGKCISVLNDINFEVKEGEFVTIIGPSGCGKTTLANIIAGYISPSMSGEVYVDNVRVTKPQRNRIVINQENDLFNWMTVSENIDFGIDRSEKKDISSYLKLIEMEGFENTYPYELSGGMKKRVSLIRALAVNPKCIIMDEPFASLDYQTREDMQDKLLLIRQTAKNTALMITHDIEEAIYLSDRIIVLSERPASIKTIINVPFIFPRKQNIKYLREFTAIKEEIRDILKIKKIT